MPVKPLHLLTDEPIGHHEQDGLGMRQYADVIAGAALGTPGPFTIGVFGDWGQGKTSLLSSAKSLVDTAGRDDVVTVWFNAWRHERDDQPIVPLIGTIVAELERRGATDDGASWRDRLTAALRAVAYGLSFKLKLGVADVGFSGKDTIEREKELLAARRQAAFDEQSFYLDAYQLLEELTGAESAADRVKIVVFIDDLDRCLPDNGLRLLEGLKLVLAQPGFVFALAVDRDVLQSYLAERYRTEFGMETDAEDRSARYLYKIVQLPLALPSHEGERFDEFIDHVKGHEALAGDDNPVAAAFEELREVLGAGSRYNPRSLVRLVNNLIVDQHTWVAAQDHAEGMLGLTAVARILRDQLGGLYRLLVADEELCTVLAEPEAEVELAVQKRFGTEEESGRRAGQRSRIAGRLERAGLGPLLATAAARAWLTNHEARRRFDQFLVVTGAEAEPGGVLDQADIVADAIRTVLDLPAAAPIGRAEREKVTNIDLAMSSITDDAIPHVAKLTRLTRLTLWDTAITDAAIPHLTQLTDLTYLDLDETAITDAAIPHLTQLTDLTHLFISGTAITDAAMPHLTPLSRLTVLSLRGTAITDAAIPHLTPLTRLTRLNLHGTAITDAAIPHLTPLTQLAHLNLGGTAITEPPRVHRRLVGVSAAVVAGLV